MMPPPLYKRSRQPSHNHRRCHTGGFTLMELLVALAIFAIIGVATALMLQRFLKQSKQLTQTEQRFDQVIKAMAIIDQDISTMSPFLTSSDQQTSFHLSPQDGLSFNRTAWTPATHWQAMGNWVHIHYQLTQHQLIRWAYYPDHPEMTVRWILLDHVKQLTWLAYPLEGAALNHWPNKPAHPTTAGPAFPKLLTLSIHCDLGQLERHWSLNQPKSAPILGSNHALNH